MAPKLPVNLQQTADSKVCSVCKRHKRAEQFPPSKSVIFPDGLSPVCSECIYLDLKEHPKDTWSRADFYCRVLDIPFIPKRWTKIEQEHGLQSFPYYARLMQESTYDGLDWKAYNDAYLTLQKRGLLERELPLIRDEERDRLRVKWGFQYSDKELLRLNALFEELTKTQNVTGGISEDVAKKICVISMLIDDNLAQGGDGVDKLIASYERLTKVGDITPKNARTDGDLSSMGEISAWLERRGWINKWYDGANMDVVDEIMNSMKTFTQRLYTHESGLAEDIEAKMQQLNATYELENKVKAAEVEKTPDTFFLGEESLEKVDLDQEEVKRYGDIT